MWRKRNRKIITPYLLWRNHSLLILFINGKATLISQMIYWGNLSFYLTLLHLNPVKAFQYKILNNILYTNTKLCKIGFRADDLCTFCEAERETLYHLLYQLCETVLEWFRIVLVPLVKSGSSPDFGKCFIWNAFNTMPFTYTTQLLYYYRKTVFVGLQKKTNTP